MDAVVWEEPLDPSDYKDFVAEWGNLMAAMSDSIQSVVVTRPLEAIAVGLEVDSTVNPVSHDADNVTIWFQVNAAFQDDAAFTGEGTRFPVAVKVTTTAQRIIEKSWNLTVAQQ